jgi:hypothetical protein
MRKILQLSIAAVVSAIIVASLASAGPGIGITIDTNSFTGTGSNGSALGLRRNCTANQILKWSGSTWACAADAGAGTGITNSAGVNVVMKSDGTNAVASTMTDNGTTVTAPDMTARRLSSNMMIIPSALPNGNTNDWNPSGSLVQAGISDTGTLQSTSYLGVVTNVNGSTLTGIAKPSSSTVNGKIIFLVNLGDGVQSPTSTLTLKHQSGSSSADNQFFFAQLQDIVIPVGGMVTLIYYNGHAHWFSLGMSTNGRYDLVTTPLANATQVNSTNITTSDYTLSPSILPTALASGSTDSWTFSGLSTSSNIHVNTNAAGSTLKGLVAQENGAVRHLINYGTGALTLEHRTSATAADQFWLPGSTSYIVGSLGAVSLVYDSGLPGWTVASSIASGSGTVANIATTAPLSGGPITTTGTLSLTTCAASQIYKMSGGVWTCSADATGGGGITNSAGANVVMKSDGANAVASTMTDNGSTVTFSGNLTSTAGSTSIGGTYGTVISPASISGTVNDWNPTSFATAMIIRVTTSATTNITGLAGAIDGHLMTLINVSASTLTISNETTSTAANRINTGSGADIALAQHQSALLVYDGTLARWRVIGRPFYTASTGIAISAANAVSANLAGASCAAGQFMTALGATGTGTCSATTINGTGNTLSKFTGANTIGNSLWTDTGSSSAYNTSAFTISTAGAATISNTLGVSGLTTTTGGLTSTAAETKVGNFGGQRITATLSANQANWAPTGIGTAMVLDLTSVTSAWNISGISSSGSTAGRVLVVLNNGGNTFTMTNQDAASSAGNQLKLTNSVSRNIGNYGAIVLVWDGTTWDEVGESSRYAPELYSLGNLTVTASSILLGDVSTFANTTLGDAAGDTISVVGTASFSVESTHPSVRTAKVATKSSCTAPTLTCGTTPSITGCDLAGTVTVGTGSPASCIITFANAFTNIPTCVVSAQNGTAKSYSTATGNVTITSPVSSTKYDYICMDH